MTADELLALAKHYQMALQKIRDNAIPFTREWKAANDALQKAPEPPRKVKSIFKQLEMFPNETN